MLSRIGMFRLEISGVKYRNATGGILVETNLFGNKGLAINARHFNGDNE